MTTLTRSQKITYTVLEGADILRRGHEVARHLWNYTRWCCIGYNEKLVKERQGYIGFEKNGKWIYKGVDWEIARRNLPHSRGEGYPGGLTLQKELKDYWAAKDLSDRCFSCTIKDFDIAMRSWFSNLKSNPKARPPKYCKDPRILNFEIGRNAKPVGEWTYRLTVLGGHIKERHAIIRLHLQPGIKMKDISLIRLQPDGTGVIVNQVKQYQSPGEAIAAIDLGIINAAVVAFQNGESIMITGKGLLAADQWGNKQAAKCKPKGWVKGKAESRQSEKFKAYRHKVGNIRRLTVHNLTRFILEECVRRQVGTLVIGDLKGIRKNADHGKAGNQKLHAWPFAEIARQLKYKGEEVGITVIKRNERGTSSRHHLTGEKGTRSPRGLVTFKKTGQIVHSDVNGAFGILNNYLAEIGQGKVSPALIRVGVEAVLPGPPSTGLKQGAGEVREPIPQIHPTFVAKFDLRNWSLKQTRCS